MQYTMHAIALIARVIELVAMSCTCTLAQLLIDGQWVAAQSGKTFPTINPQVIIVQSQFPHPTAHRPARPAACAAPDPDACLMGLSSASSQNETEICQVAEGDKADVELAVKAARKVVGLWGRLAFRLTLNA